MCRRRQKTIPVIAIASMAILLVSYKPAPTGLKRICGEGIKLSEVRRDDSIISILKNYMRRRPRYNTYVLSRAIGLSLDDNKKWKGLIFGPGYRPLYGRREKMDTLWLNGKCIISFDSIDSRDLYYKEGFLEYKNTHKEKQDLYIQSNGYVVDDELCNYIFRSVYIDRVEGKLIINTRPDTLFLPVFEKSNIKFTCPKGKGW